MRKPAIPDVPRTQDAARARFDHAVKENLELVTGRRGARIKLLAADAGLAEIIAKVNEIVEALQ